MHHVSEDAEGSTGLALALALALARWIAHAHGGEIVVMSADGKRTAFTLMLPHRPE